MITMLRFQLAAQNGTMCVWVGTNDKAELG